MIFPNLSIQMLVLHLRMLSVPLCEKPFIICFWKPTVVQRLRKSLAVFLYGTQQPLATVF